jgi:hypothetical protein
VSRLVSRLVGTPLVGTPLVGTPLVGTPLVLPLGSLALK